MQHRGTDHTMMTTVESYESHVDHFVRIQEADKVQ